MYTEIQDRNPVTVQNTIWRVCVRSEFAEPKVEFYEINPSEPNYSFFVASYFLENLQNGPDAYPICLDPAHPDRSLSGNGLRQVRNWLNHESI